MVKEIAEVAKVTREFTKSSAASSTPCTGTVFANGMLRQRGDLACPGDTGGFNSMPRSGDVMVKIKGVSDVLVCLVKQGIMHDTRRSGQPLRAVRFDEDRVSAGAVLCPH